MGFQCCGPWTDFFMPKGNFTAGHKGICFISFVSPESVQYAMQNGPHEIRGQQVIVDVATPREPKGASKGGSGKPPPKYGIILPGHSHGVIPPSHSHGVILPSQ